LPVKNETQGALRLRQTRRRRLSKDIDFANGAQGQARAVLELFATLTVRLRKHRVNYRRTQLRKREKLKPEKKKAARGFSPQAFQHRVLFRLVALW
jgi:hypothetical protein